MSAAAADNNNDNNSNICANCGKGEEGSASLKACTACKMVKYCNRECQIAHRPQHKKQCKKRAAELHDEKLFKQPPLQYGDCPICFLRLPTLRTIKVLPLDQSASVLPRHHSVVTGTRLLF